MTSQLLCLSAHRVRALAIASILGAIVLTAGLGLVSARQGHDHGEEQSAAGGPASPRVIASSEKYQLVGIVEGEVLVTYLDRAEDNAPVTTATLEVSLDGETFKAELQEKNGTYEITAPLLREPGSKEVLITLSDGDTSDLLVGSLTIPAAEAKAPMRRSLLQSSPNCVRACPRATAWRCRWPVSCWSWRR